MGLALNERHVGHRDRGDRRDARPDAGGRVGDGLKQVADGQAFLRVGWHVPSWEVMRAVRPLGHPADEVSTVGASR